MRPLIFSLLLVGYKGGKLVVLSACSITTVRLPSSTEKFIPVHILFFAKQYRLTSSESDLIEGLVRIALQVHPSMFAGLHKKDPATRSVGMTGPQAMRLSGIPLSSTMCWACCTVFQLISCTAYYCMYVAYVQAQLGYIYRRIGLQAVRLFCVYGQGVEDYFSI